MLILGIIAVMMLIIGSVGYVTTRDDDRTTDDAADDLDDGSSDEPEPTEPPGTTTPEESPSTTEPDSSPSTTAPPIDDAEFVALVRELQTYVEDARGLEFKRDVVVELRGDEAFEAGLLADFEEDAEELAEAEVFYRALGLVEGEESLEELLREIYAAAVLGYYDTETDELVVRGASATPYVQQTIVHELVHALDDQHFELYRPQYDDRDDETGLGFSSVVEGNARRVEADWLDDQPEDVQDEAEAEELTFGDGIDVDDFPPILLFEIGAPYQFGEVLVDELVRGDGEPAVNDALRNPPSTSEQVLYPPLFAEREPRVEVPPPPADGELVDEGVVGALFLYGILTDPSGGVNPSDAARAVEGWGGDWFVTWTGDDELNCVRADFVGDTDRDTDEIQFALEAWVDTAGVGAVSDADGRVRLESCVAGGGGSRDV